MEMIYKTAVCKVLEADRSKPIIARVSTASIDMQGDVIWQQENEHGKGWLLNDFNQRGGRIYWMHNPWVPNLARAKAWVDQSGLMLSVVFDEKDELAATLDRKVRDGYLDEWSVGFEPTATKPRDGGGLDIYEAKLWEVSLVNQGANMETATVQKGLASIADAAAVAAMYDDRLRGIEAEIMKMSKRLAIYESAAPTVAASLLDKIRARA